MIGMLYMTAATGLCVFAFAHAWVKHKENEVLKAEIAELIPRIPTRVGGTSDVCKDPDWNPFD